MKKRLLAGVILLSLTLAGCTSTQPTLQPDETTAQVAESTTSPIRTEATTEAAEITEAQPAMMDDFQTLLTQTSHAGDLGLFIKDNIADASTEDAELMLQWLFIYQSELILKINDLIYTEAYANPLYDVMGGILDPEKVVDIEDPTVRNDYQALVDGYMTLVRYEETPAIETDWAALTSLNDAFSPEMADLLTLRAESQFFYTEDFYFMAERVVMVEDMIASANDGFLKNQLQQLHRNFVYDVLVGPEGMYMGTFVGKSDEAYNTLMTFAGDFSDSSFGQFLFELDAQEWGNFVGPQDAVSNYVAFGYGSDYQWDLMSVMTDLVEGEKYQLMSDAHQDMAAKVNEGINEAIESLGANTNGQYGYNTYPSYNTENYVSLYVSLRHLATTDQIKYLESAITFDLSTGEMITLSDYLGVTDEEAIAIVNDVVGTGFTMMPNFQIMSNGLMLTPQIDETGEPKWGMMPTKALVPYVSFENLQK